MRLNRFLIVTLISWIAANMSGETAMAKEDAKVIKTYMSVGLPLDPANIKTLADLDIAYALGASLVAFNAAKDTVAGLAESWKSTGPNEVSFVLRKGAKWSDGSTLTAQQVVKSFERAERVHGSSLKTFFDLVESIKTIDERTVVFKLSGSAEKSAFARKLTEPMYGVVFVKEDGSLDLGKTVGPFAVSSASSEEIVFSVNRNWYAYHPHMPDRVEIRRPAPGQVAEEIIAKDQWVNLISSTSLVGADSDCKFAQGKCTVWNRNIYKIFAFYPGPKLANQQGRDVIRYLYDNLDRKQLLKNVKGYHPAEQFFRPGYVLFDPEFKIKPSNASVPATYSEKPLKILAVQGRVMNLLRENIAAAIKVAVGIEPEFNIVPLHEYEKARVAGDYDLVAISIPVNDPNVEGAMGFFFGISHPYIPNAGVGEKDYLSRFDIARKAEDQSKRYREYRKIFTDAIQDGCLLPLFHSSSVVLAREGIDLSGVPMTDETVTFSKVRFQ